jgi:cobalt-precorrin 5A hydrolase
VEKMKLAIISVTTAGKNLAEHLKEILIEDPTIIAIELFHKKVNETLNNIFPNFDAILGIMASGIMIRSICGLLKSKTSDPAVLVMDESSKHVISLVSGHLGGANNLAMKISNSCGADPVITTATDVQGRLGIDELARKYYWEIKNPEEIVYFNRGILKGDKIGLITDLNVEYIFQDPKTSINYFKSDSKLSNLKNNDLIHEKSFLEIKPKDNEILAILNEKLIIMKPKKLVVGIGSRKGVSKDHVLNAIEKSLEILDLPIDRIDAMATGEMKSNEKGIMECAPYLGINLDIVLLKNIKSLKSSQCTFSEFVEENFGVGGVCEPSALISAGKGSQLIFKKTAYNGVTVAVAVL